MEHPIFNIIKVVAISFLVLLPGCRQFSTLKEAPTLSTFIGDYDSSSPHWYSSTEKVAARVIDMPGDRDGIQILIGSEFSRRSNFNSNDVDTITLIRNSDGDYLACRNSCLKTSPVHIGSSGEMSFIDDYYDMEVVLKFDGPRTIRYVKKYRECWIGGHHLGCLLSNPFTRGVVNTYVLNRLEPSRLRQERQ